MRGIPEQDTLEGNGGIPEQDSEPEAEPVSQPRIQSSSAEGDVMDAAPDDDKEKLDEPTPAPHKAEDKPKSKSTPPKGKLP